MDLISVIIPVYNVEPYLNRCMESVLNQTYTNLEIILVDDKSKDRSKELCLTYLKDKRVIIVEHDVNKGLGGARNSGLEIAHGRYVVFVDSDDYIELDMIENLYTCMMKTGADTVIGGFRRVMGTKIEIQKNKCAGIVYDNSDDIKNEVLKKMLGPNEVDYIEMSVWKTMYSIKIIKTYKVRFPDKKYLSEDIIFDFSYFPHSKCVAMCDDTGYCYCHNEASLSQNYQIDKEKKLAFQVTEMKRLATQNGFGSEAFYRINNYFLGNIVHHLKCLITSTTNRRVIMEKIMEICLMEEMRSIIWTEAHKYFKGKDWVPLKCIKAKKTKILYAYLKILTTTKKVVRMN